MATRDIAHRHGVDQRKGANHWAKVQHARSHRTHRQLNRLWSQRCLQDAEAWDEATPPTGRLGGWTRSGGFASTTWIRWIYRRCARGFVAFATLRKEALQASHSRVWKFRGRKVLEYARDRILEGWHGAKLEQRFDRLGRPWRPELPPSTRLELYGAREFLHDEHLDVRSHMRLKSERFAVETDNRNRLVTEGWSSEASRVLFRSCWRDDRDEAEIRGQVARDETCKNCAYFGPLDQEWGLCLSPRSRHRLETLPPAPGPGHCAAKRGPTRRQPAPAFPPPSCTPPRQTRPASALSAGQQTDPVRSSPLQQRLRRRAPQAVAKLSATTAPVAQVAQRLGPLHAGHGPFRPADRCMHRFEID